jgi:hypothetical protein
MGLLKSKTNQKPKNAHNRQLNEVLRALRSTSSAGSASSDSAGGASSSTDSEFTGTPMGADQELADYLVACSKALGPHYDTEPKHKAQVSRKMGLQEANAQRLQTENEQLRQEKDRGAAG